MNSGEDNSDPIPIDLIIEILLRLPAKSIARFRCVSKLWSSILHRQYFKELFLTRSRARPRLLFALKSLQGEWSLFSSPQPQPQKSSSLIVSADVHTNFPRDNMCISGRGRFSYCYASGLIYFSGRYEVTVICHPSTGEYAILPTLMTRYGTSHSLLGFDPIDKQFKVLSIATPSWDKDGFESFDHNVQTLGTGNMRWRKIQCPLPHYPLSDGTCINGVLYYVADDDDVVDDMIVCFDVRSEKFKFIRFRDYITKLINYKGKLGVIWLNYDDIDAIELHIWVLEDAEKQEWSKYVYTLPENKALRNFSVVGVIATGEIVLSMDYTSTHFYVFYFNPERNTLQNVEIQGLDEKHSTVYAFLDHVEDLNANDAKILNVDR